MPGARIRDESLTAAPALRYVHDTSPGIRRARRAKTFVYFDLRGKRIDDEAELQRIRAIAVPPAYEEVWICPSATGHLQATGRDARGRKQYRYHKAWRAIRDKAKYRRSIAFAHALPALRSRIATDLATPGLSREKVLAAVARLLDTTFARIGNESYARDNGSYGLTTLRSRHVRVKNGVLQLRFRGKSGVDHAIFVSDRKLTAIIRRCRDLPGQELFTYIDESGNPVPIGSDDINAYVREAMGDEFTAKDFRTWHGTVLCAIELAALPSASTLTERRSAVRTAMACVAGALRNTVAVCRSCYVHPSVVDQFLIDGALRLPRVRATRATSHLDADEARVLRFLERTTQREARAAARSRRRRP